MKFCLILKMKMKRFLPIAFSFLSFLGGCGKYERVKKIECGYVTRRQFTPESSHVSCDTNFNDGFVKCSVKTDPARYMTMFRIFHGGTIEVEGTSSKHMMTWEKSREGDIVNIVFNEVWFIPDEDDKSSEKKFIDIEYVEFHRIDFCGQVEKE